MRDLFHIRDALYNSIVIILVHHNNCSNCTQYNLRVSSKNRTKLPKTVGMFSVSSIAPVLYIAVLDLIYMSFFQRNVREPGVSRPLFRPPPSASEGPPWWS